VIVIPTDFDGRVRAHLERAFDVRRGFYESVSQVLAAAQELMTGVALQPCNLDSLSVYPATVNNCMGEVINPTQKFLKTLLRQEPGVAHLVFPSSPVRWTDGTIWVVQIRDTIPALRLAQAPIAHGATAYTFVRTLCELDGKQWCLVSTQFSFIKWQWTRALTR
jgi:hypothetical protein